MLGARVLFRPNPRGVKAALRNPKVGRRIDEAGTAIAKAIRTAAPYYSGAFARSIRHNRAGRRLDVRRGWVGRVVSTDPFWHLEEYGSINNAPHRSFERGVRAAGLKFRDHR